MENKTTTELLNLLPKLVDKDSNLKDGYEECLAELKSREPFWSILNEDYESSLPGLETQIDELKEEVKKLKRHKHDEKTGDVLIRI